MASFDAESAAKNLLFGDVSAASAARILLEESVIAEGPTRNLLTQSLSTAIAARILRRPGR
jgi:hypothetical protein